MEETPLIMPVVLSNGTTMLVEVRPVGRQPVTDLPPFPFKTVMATVEGIAAEFGALLTRVRPDVASVEMGLEVALESGNLATVLVKGSGKANFVVKFEWRAATAGEKPASECP